jgi:hypothetical protein
MSAKVFKDDQLMIDLLKNNANNNIESHLHIYSDRQGYFLETVSAAWLQVPMPRRKEYTKYLYSLPRRLSPEM